MANVATIVGYAGNAIQLVITVLQTDGSPYNLTGVTSIKYSLGGALITPALITKTLGAGIAITNATGGIFTVSLAETDTASLVTGSSAVQFYHEALLVDAAGNPVTCYSGYLTLNPTLVKK